MHQTIFTGESLTTNTSQDVNVFNATKINLMAQVTFTTQTASTFLLIQAISIANDFVATLKTYELKPTESGSDGVLTVADVLDVEPVAAIRIKAINNDTTAVTLDVDIETTEAVLC